MPPRTVLSELAVTTCCELPLALKPYVTSGPPQRVNWFMGVNSSLGMGAITASHRRNLPQNDIDPSRLWPDEGRCLIRINRLAVAVLGVLRVQP